MDTEVLVLIVLCCSTFIRSAFGFGDALVAMPLLALVVGLKTATPLVALVASTIGLAILLKNWRSVQIQSAWRLIVATIAGIPLGLLLLKGAYEGLLQILLAVILIGFAVFSLLKSRQIVIRGEKLAFGFGFVAGILGGAYNTNGPPVVIYGTLKGWNPATFRATLQGYFLPTSLFITAGHGSTGLWTGEVLRLYLYALPLVFASIFLGGWINRRFSPQRFSQWVYALLIALGALLLWRTLGAAL
jgi:uncharacterized membrane protein YfcA